MIRAAVKGELKWLIPCEVMPARPCLPDSILQKQECLVSTSFRIGRPDLDTLPGNDSTGAACCSCIESGLQHSFSRAAGK